GEGTAGVPRTPSYEEPTVLVARRNHPRCAARTSKAVLASLRHVDVQVAPGRGYRDLAARYARLGIARDVALVVPSFTSAAAIVAATDFVATVPASLVAVLGERLGIRQVAYPMPGTTVASHLCWHERTDGDPALRAFRELILRAAPGRQAKRRGGKRLRAEPPPRGPWLSNG